MEVIIESGLTMVRWLQDNYPEFAGLMVVVSDLGLFDVYLALVLFFYWCVNKTRAKHMAYLLALGNVSFTIAKHALQGARPFWLEPELLIGEASGYGVPSGHTTSVTLAFVFLAVWFRKRWVWAVAAGWILLMALSRIYLGHHFPHDIAAAFLLCLLIFIVYFFWRRYGYETFRDRILGQRFWIAVSVPIIFSLLYGLVLWLRPIVERTGQLADLAAAAEWVSFEDAIAALAILFGLGIGFVLEGRDVRFYADGEWWRRGIRYVLGLGLVLGLLYGLRALFNQLAPDDGAVWLILLLRFVRYFLVAMVAAYYLPMAFTATGLADAEPQQGIDTSLNRIIPRRDRE